MGSMNSKWDRYNSASAKRKFISDLGGIGNIEVSDLSWEVEEGTVLHLSSCEALASGKYLTKYFKLFFSSSGNFCICKLQLSKFES